MKPLLLAILLLATAVPTFAQKMQTPTGEAPGPWLFGTIGVGKNADGSVKTTALKGLAIKVGEHGEAAVAYDLNLCRMVGAWTGKFVTPMNLMSRGEYPTAMGEVAFTTGAVPGFLASTTSQTDWKDPRSEPFGPLPRGQARFRGFHPHGSKAVLTWDVGGTEILETPDYIKVGKRMVFVRGFLISPHTQPILLTVASNPAELQSTALVDKSPDVTHEVHWQTATGTNGRTLYWFPFDEAKTREIQYDSSLWRLRIEPSPVPRHLCIGLWSGIAERLEDIGTELSDSADQGITYTAPDELEDVSENRWPETIVSQGVLANPNSKDAYVVDTIKLPDPNPWSAPMFLGGFDFFPDGRAAVCTFHGDVFIVSGLDEKLEHVSWRRFASGLYHALGLKIFNGEIYVTCRDGITRLKDLNGDGEADFYERFNNDLKVTKSFHEFVFDLQTDPAGNFYFSKAGPVKNGGRGFDEIMSQHGTLMRVTPDGAKLDVIATGFRAPNGIGVGPHGELTSGDNEGTWTPACKINWIKPGGFYGVVDLAHRTPAPTSFDPPLCWLPKRVDNSGGSQVWVPDDERWGPWRGKMLHLSYGQSSLFGVLMEEVPAAENLQRPTLMQGGVTKFPLQFQSGIMRARFNPKDGQLYVCGLRGWQTNGLKNGCFQRVRYTGAVPRMPIEIHARKGGIELRFACSLDTQTASDPENWHLEQWRYLWSSAYGSPELSTAGADAAPGELGKDGRAEFITAQMQKPQHDAVTVKAVAIGTDDRSVFLEIPELKPVMQMSIKYDLKSADGTELRGEVVNTIHALPAE